ncbi:MAG: response regulator [Chloroflexi bacterium]|nr:response regulator [Chloroflexota bacterium]
MPSANPAEKIRVLIVDDITETRDNIKKLLYFEDDMEVVGGASSGEEGIEQAEKLSPDIVLMDINMKGMDGIAASEIISSKFPHVQVMMMSVQGESDYLRRSMLAGAREFLIKPFSGEDLSTSIRRVYQLGAARRANAPAAPPPPTTATPAAPPPPPPKGGKIIAVFGTKGGVGSSTIAVNLAVALREETKARVALIDANFEFGDCGVLLNLPTNRTIADLSEPTLDLDEDIVGGTMAGHSSGVKVLLAPLKPEMAELITPALVKQLLEILPKMFDYIVVDVWKSFNESMLTFLDASEQIILISSADIPAIKNAKLFFELSEALGYPPEKTFFVLNKEDGRSGINARDIEASVKHSVRGLIPRDERTTVLAVNRGTPFVTGQRNLPLTQGILALVRAVRKPQEEPATAAAVKKAR